MCVCVKGGKIFFKKAAGKLLLWLYINKRLIAICLLLYFYLRSFHVKKHP